MRVFINVVALLSALALSANAALPSPCLAVCFPTEPICPPGQTASGSPTCWGCCRPTSPYPTAGPSSTPAPIDARQDFGDGAERPCPKICRLEKPECPYGEAPTGGEGCWGCCQPIKA